MAIAGASKRRRGAAVLVGGLATCAATLTSTNAFALPEGRRACIAAYENVQVQMRRSRLLEAREAASACLAQGCPSALRAECGNWLKDVEARMPTVVVECKVPNDKPVAEVRLLLDGVPWKDHPDGVATEVNPGEHVIRAERASGPPAEVRIIVAEGKKAQRVVIELPAEEPAEHAPPSPPPPPPVEEVRRVPAPVPAVAYVFGAASLLAAGGFTFFAIDGKHAEHGLDACSPRCSDDAVGGVRQRYIVADVLLGVSVIALGLAAYFVFSKGSVSVTSRSAASSR